MMYLTLENARTEIVYHTVYSQSSRPVPVVYDLKIDFESYAIFAHRYQLFELRHFLQQNAQKRDFCHFLIG